MRDVDVVAQVGEASEHEAAVAARPLRVERAVHGARDAIPCARRVDGVDLVGADRKSTRLNSSHGYISYAVFCLKKKKTQEHHILYDDKHAHNEPHSETSS